MSGEKRAMLRACGAMLPLAVVAALALVLVASMLARAGVPPAAAYAVSIVSAALGTLLISRGGRTLIALPSPAIATWLIYEEIIARGLMWQEALGIVAIVSLLYVLLFRAERETHPLDLLPPIVRTGLLLGLGFSMLVTACLYARILLPSPWALTMGGTLSDPLMYYTLVGIALTLVLHTMRMRGAVLIGMALVGTLTLLEGFWEMPAAPFLLPEGLDQTVGALTFPMRIEAAVTVGVTLFFALMVESGASLAAVESLSAKSTYRGLTRLLGANFGAALLGAFPLTITPLSAVVPAQEDAGRIGGIPYTACAFALLLVLLLPCAPLVQAIADFPAMPAAALFCFGLMLFTRGLHLLQASPEPLTLGDALVLAIFFLASFDIKVSLMDSLLVCILLGIAQGTWWKTRLGTCAVAALLLFFFLFKFSSI
jgi:hypothetical protein